MSVRYATAVRNAMLDAISTLVGNGGAMAVYSGTQPATGGTVTTKLAEFTMGTPFAAAASAGALSVNLPADTTGLPAAGAGTTATWVRVVSAGGAFAMDLAIGAEVTFTSPTISNGGVVKCISFTITL